VKDFGTGSISMAGCEVGNNSLVNSPTSSTVKSSSCPSESLCNPIILFLFQQGKKKIGFASKI
jgi:hypothetical protein